MTLIDVGLLLLLSSLWGSSFLFIRIVAPVLGPILLVFLRVSLAAVALLGYSASIRKVPNLRDNWRHYLVIGAINAVVPMGLISAAELRLPASLAAVLNATTPLFGALAAVVWIGEPMTLRKVAGLLVGIVGVATLVGLGPVPVTPLILISISFSLLAGLSYGVAAVYTKAKVAGGSPMALTTYSNMFAGLILLPFVPFVMPHQAPSATVVWSILALGLLCTALAYLTFFILIMRIGPMRATMSTYMSPVFGTLWGFLFLKESMGWGSLLGFLLVLSSVVLVTNVAPKADLAQSAAS